MIRLKPILGSTYLTIPPGSRPGACPGGPPAARGRGPGGPPATAVGRRPGGSRPPAGAASGSGGHPLYLETWGETLSQGVIRTPMSRDTLALAPSNGCKKWFRSVALQGQVTEIPNRDNNSCTLSLICALCQPTYA